MLPMVCLVFYLNLRVVGTNEFQVRQNDTTVFALPSLNIVIFQ